MGQIVFRMIVGAVAGFVAWLIWEPQFSRIAVDPTTGMPVDSLWGVTEARFIVTLGGLIGAAIGGLNGWLQGSKGHLFRGLLVGLGLGLIGSWIGYRVGGALLEGLFARDVFVTGNAAARVLARVVAFLPLGTLLGLAIGAAGWTGRRVVVGGSGGFLGALLSGFLFDAVSSTLGGMILSLRGGTIQEVNGVPIQTGEIGQPGRAFTALLMGAFIALFIGIVDRITRTAWVRLSLGRNEGKEWVVDATQTYIGRSEWAQIPLYGDPNVAPMHACIVRQGHVYTLMDGGSPIGTLLNGQRVQQAPLFDGAQIQIGPYVLHFMLRHGSAPQRAAEAYRAQPFGAAQPQMPVGAAPGHAAFGAQPQMPTQAMPYPAQPQPGQPMTAGPYPGHPQAPTVPPGQPTTAFPAQAPSAQPFAPAGMAGFCLVAVDGPLVGQRFDVRGPVEIGREATGIRLGFDSSASRRHASVTPGADGLAVQDLGSTNGTFVNQQRVQSGMAKIGDIVKVGGTSFQVESA